MAFSFAGRYGAEQQLSSGGGILRSTAVTVYQSDGSTLATLYSSRTKAATVANPVSTDSRGNLSFFADPGEYVLSVAGSTVAVTVPIDPVEAAQDTDVSAHAAVTANVHGIADMSVLAATLKSDRALRLLQSPSARVGIARVSSTQYRLYQKLAGEHYWRVNLTQLSGLLGGAVLHLLHLAYIDMPWLSVDHTDAAVVRTGAGWSGPTVQAASYGGSYHQNNTGTGQDVTWTTPAGVTRVGMRTVAATNGGIHKVQIDGDATAANLLPTAQTLVTRGQLASTALVANGGTLNPTDRVLDLYVAASDPSTTVDYDRHIAFADGLAAGVHTVKVTITGYQNVAAVGGFRLYDSGWTYGAVDTGIDTATMELLPHTRLMANYDSAWEYAYEFLPAGGAYTFIGNVHGYEQQTSLAIAVDGDPITLVDGQREMGNSVEVRRVTSLRHPSVGAGATTVADVSTTYTLDRSGMTVGHRDLWRVAGTLRAAYPAMFPLDGRVFDKGAGSAVAADATLTANAGAYAAAGTSATLYAWESAGKFAAALHLPDLKGTVNNFATAAPIYAAIEDRVPVSVNAGDLSKMYMTRSGTTTTEAVTAGTDRYSQARYLIARLPDANGSLAST